ncbi:hypothetical protein CK203_040255 [Vitis vinifera]|uniref:Uncharacterized protein n=1 Tax=Vitis vinifera TaxID=29760 RepID=A0A438HX90_VITVI|nr:hypothetical protein CK203_040255 [Vitis vinifera]
MLNALQHPMLGFISLMCQQSLAWAFPNAKGARFENEEELKEGIGSYFKSVFEDSQVRRPDVDSGLFRSLDSLDNEGLEEPFSEEENAVLQSLNATFLVLIPKKEGANDIRKGWEEFILRTSIRIGNGLQPTNMLQWQTYGEARGWRQLLGCVFQKIFPRLGTGGAVWGKILTVDTLMKRGWSMANRHSVRNLLEWKVKGLRKKIRAALRRDIKGFDWLEEGKLVLQVDHLEGIKLEDWFGEFFMREGPDRDQKPSLSNDAIGKLWVLYSFCLLFETEWLSKWWWNTLENGEVEFPPMIEARCDEAFVRHLSTT